MILYGRNVIKEILKSGRRKIYMIYAIEGLKDLVGILNEAEDKGIKTVPVDKKKLFELTKTDKHQGIAAKTEGVALFSPEEFLNRKKNEENIAIAALDNVTDPRNMGAIIRSCEVFGVRGILITPKCAPITDTVYKASSGALEYVDVINATNMNNAFRVFKGNGFWIYGFDLNADKYLDETEFDKKSVLVFGSEGQGMKRLVKENCDFLVKIRQKGRIDSLNISNAAAIAFYHLAGKA